MKNIVYNFDCMKFMKDKPDNYYDLAPIDPPYGIGESKDKSSRNCNRIDPRNGRPIIVKNKPYKEKEWDNKPANKLFFNELFRISKNQIIFGANHFIENINKNSSCWIVWNKVNGKSDFADCELAWTSFKTAVRKFDFMWNGFTQGIDENAGLINQGNKNLCEKRIHPTQKPVALYKWLLKNYAKPNDKIFDSHVGSGSSRIACYELGFDFEGCELDKDYWQAQEKRFELEKAKIDNRFYLPEEKDGLF